MQLVFVVVVAVDDARGGVAARGMIGDPSFKFQSADTCDFLADRVSFSRLLTAPPSSTADRRN